MDANSSDNEDPSTPLLTTPVPADDEDDDVDVEDPFEILARVTPSPEAIPWEQRSTKMKVIHMADRIFLAFLAVFFLVLMVELSYILYHIVPWSGLFQYLTDRLLMQEEGEEDYEL